MICQPCRTAADNRESHLDCIDGDGANAPRAYRSCDCQHRST
jgi:hypothetical protein